MRVIGQAVLLFLAAAAYGDDLIVTWDYGAESPIAGFFIERSVDAAPFDVLATLAYDDRSYVDPALGSGDYCYRLQAFDTEKISPYSNVACAVIAVAPSIPLPPSGLAVTAVTSSMIAMAWTDNSNNETGFQVQRKRHGNYATIATLGPGATSYQDLGRPPKTEFCYRVRAVNEVGASSWSSEACATTLVSPRSQKK